MQASLRIYTSSMALMAPMTLQQTFVKVVAEAINLAHADYGSIILRTKKGEIIRVYANHPSLYKIPIRKNGNIYRTFRYRETQIILRKDLLLIHPEVKKMAYQSSLLIPLYYQKKSIGVLNIVSKRNKFKPLDVKFLEIFAPIASLAIFRAQALAEKQQALDSRDLFISIAAHEFRTPLTTLSAYLQLMTTKSKAEKPIPKEWISLANAETKRLIKMVDELLEVNEIQARSLKYDFQPNSLGNIIHQAVGIVKATKPNRKVLILSNIENADRIYADYDKLLQVFLNILNNAIKFSNDKSKITIKLHQKSASLLEVSILDEGIGIAPIDQPFIFQEFYKGKNTDAKSGKGLGLYLAKTIIDGHKGSIKLASHVGKGTTITVLLPKLK